MDVKTLEENPEPKELQSKKEEGDSSYEMDDEFEMSDGGESLSKIDMGKKGLMRSKTRKMTGKELEQHDKVHGDHAHHDLEKRIIEILLP